MTASTRGRVQLSSPAAGVAFGGRDPNLSRDAKGMTAAGLLDSPIRGQRLAHRLLIHTKRSADRSQAHPELAHGSSFSQNSLVAERLTGEYRELNLDFGGGSNWL